MIVANQNSRDITNMKDTHIQLMKNDKTRKNYFIDGNGNRSSGSKGKDYQGKNRGQGDMSLTVNSDRKKNMVLFRKPGSGQQKNDNH